MPDNLCHAIILCELGLCIWTLDTTCLFCLLLCSGVVVGTSLSHYLLEKSRVVFQVRPLFSRILIEFNGLCIQTWVAFSRLAAAMHTCNIQFWSPSGPRGEELPCVLWDAGWAKWLGQTGAVLTGSRDILLPQSGQTSGFFSLLLYLVISNYRPLKINTKLLSGCEAMHGKNSHYSFNKRIFKYIYIMVEIFQLEI